MEEITEFKDGDEVLIKATVSSDFITRNINQKFFKVIRCVTAENGEVVWCNPKELIKVAMK